MPQIRTIEIVAGDATPTISDDGSKGYVRGMLWEYNNQMWVCRDNTNGAANWLELVFLNEVTETFKTGSATLTKAEVQGGFIVNKTGSGVVDTMTLPIIDAELDGREVSVKRDPAKKKNTVVAANAADDIDGDATYTIKASGYTLTLVASLTDNTWRIK